MTDKPYLTLKKPPLNFDKLNEFCVKTMEISKLLSEIESLVDKMLEEKPIPQGDNPYDICDGNFDDCYELGYQHGIIYIALEIKEILK